MFRSFFPRPGLFALSAALWIAVSIGLWYGLMRGLPARFGLDSSIGADEVVGVSRFWTPDFLWFDAYYLTATGLFFAFWAIVSPHRWQAWSILGTALIIFTTYISVEISVAINAWYGPYYDLIQKAMTEAGAVPARALYEGIGTFVAIAFFAVALSVLNQFFVSHYIFRWRTAMNEYFMARWPVLRHVEGASQRIQEDTMRFASTVEGLGIQLVSAVMTLIAFLPVLFSFSKVITTLPIIGEVPHALVWAAVVWSVFGTGLLALVGIRLPGLEFNNQKVEAAYRKELVYGEDDPGRALPPTVAELFANVRKSYFRLYFHYLYFNVARVLYLQADNVYGTLILIPSIVAGKVTLGLMNQVLNVFDQVRGSFQYLVTSWPTIVELLSIYKRLRAFEEHMAGEPKREIAEG